MKLIEKLRGPALNAANARINELEERLEEAKKDGQDGWDRLAQCRVEKVELRDELEKARAEKSELKYELEKAQNASQRRRVTINQGRWCGTCKHQVKTERLSKSGVPLTTCGIVTQCDCYEARE